jgi:predicted DNA-binding protein with PD1-like motif
MRWRMLAEVEGLRTFVLVFDKGDDPVELLPGFAAEQSCTGSSFTAVGAVASATLGYFDRERREYQQSVVDEQCEVLSLLGDIATHDRKPAVHAHAVLGRRDLSTVGGHLFAASVWPTLELVLTESPAHLRKRYDPDTGLALIDP